MPSAAFDWPGARQRIETIVAPSRRTSVASARFGSPGKLRIRSRLIETATNSRPVSAAAAPAVATNRSLHCSGE